MLRARAERAVSATRRRPTTTAHTVEAERHTGSVDGMSSPAPVKRPRRTQEERSTATRSQLLDATIDSLVELGYSGTTTTVIAERAGVSRGAQLHHYPTKAELVAAAVEHLAMRLFQQFDSGFRTVRDTDRLSYCFDALWSAFSSPLFAAWLELAVAARTDDELRRSLEPFETWLEVSVLGRIETVFGDAIKLGPQQRVALAMTVSLFRGMSLARHTGTGQFLAVDDLIPQMLEAWKTMIRRELSGT